MVKKAKTADKVDKKRHGVHRNQSKHFMRVYWPYIPSALALVLTIAIVMVQPSTLGRVLPYATNVSSSGLLVSTNEQRTENGVTTLKLNGRLTNAAQAKAEDMATKDYWSHNTPDGKEPWVFLDSAGYKYLKAGENLAYGFMSSDSAVTGWMNSASHRANLLDNAFTEVGFGFANSADYQDEGNQTIVVAMYGKPQVKSESVSQPAPKPAGAAPSSSDSAPPAETPTEPVVSSDNVVIEPPTETVAVVEAITNGEAPWAIFAVGLASGGAVSTLLIRHGIKLKHLLKNSEKFVLHHPIIDTSLLIVIVLCVFLSKSVVFIR